MTAKAHFHVLGIPVRIEPLFWMATVLLAYGLGDARLIVTWVAVVLVSVLVHELGHAITLKLFGQSSSIVLHGFGGLTFSQRRLGRLRSIVVSLAGPIAALVLLGLPALLLRDSRWGTQIAFDYALGDSAFGWWPVVYFAAYVNVWWSIANLLPIRPLDGGNVLTEIVGLQPARLVSAVVGAAAAVWAYTHADGLRYAAFFAGFLAFINLSEYRRARGGAPAPTAFAVDGPPVPGGGGVRPGEPADERSRAQGQAAAERSPARGGRPVGPPLRRPTDGRGASVLGGGMDPGVAEDLIWNLLRRGDVPGARRILDRARGATSSFAAATVAAAAGEGLDALVAAYLERPGGPATLVTASVVGDRGEAELLAHRLLAAGPAGVEAAGSLQTHLHYAERFRDAAAVGELVHDVASGARAQVAFDVACSWARAGEPERALRWVEVAIGDGFRAGSLLDGEPDLAVVRTLPAWPALRARAR